MAIFVPRKPGFWKSQHPTNPVELSESHWLRKGLTQAVLLGASKTQTERIYGDLKGSGIITGLTYTPEHGIFNGSDWINLGAQNKISATGYTLTFMGYVDSFTTYRALIMRDYTNGVRCYQTRTTPAGKFGFIRFDSSNSVLDNFESSATIATKQRFIVSFVFKKGSGSYIYLDGKQVGSSTSFLNTDNNVQSSGEPTYIGRRTDAGPTVSLPLYGGASLVTIHNIALDADQIDRYHAAPYNLFKKRGTQFYIASGAIEAALSLAATVGHNSSTIMTANDGLSLGVSKAINSSAVATLNDSLTLSTTLSASSQSALTAFESFNLDATLSEAITNDVSQNVTLTLTQTLGVSDSSQAAMLGSVALGASAGVSASTTATMNAGSVLAGILGASSQSNATLNDGLTLAALAGISESANVVTNATLTLTTNAGVTITAAIVGPGSVEAFMTLAHTQGVSVVTQVDYNPTLTLAIDNTLSANGTGNISDSISLAVSTALSTAAGKDIVETLTLALSSGANVSGNVDIQGTLNLGVNAGFVDTSVGVMGGDLAFAVQLVQDAATQAIINSGLSLDCQVTFDNSGVNPAVVIRTRGDREILLTVSTRNFLLTRDKRNILLN